MKYHPYADLFPLLDGIEFIKFVEDIRTNGLLNAITVFDDMILDGRNRERACIEAGVTPHYKKLRDGTDPLRFVASQNLHRRQLTPVQSSFIAARMANMKVGGKETNSAKLRNCSEPLISEGEAAKLMNVSPRYVSDAQVILATGDAELIEKTQLPKNHPDAIPLAPAAKAARAAKKGTAPPPPVKPVKATRGKKPTPKLDDAIKANLDAIDKTGEPLSRGATQGALGGSSSGTADTGIAAAVAYKKGYEDGLNAAAANPDLLGATYGAKYERAVKHMDRLIKDEIEFQTKVRVEVSMKKLVDEYWLPDEKARIKRLEGLASRKTPFTYDEYRKLLAALHPDKPDGDDRVAAFQLVKDRAPILRPIQREEEPPPFRLRTREEFLAEKARRAEAAKTERAARKGQVAAA